MPRKLKANEPAQDAGSSTPTNEVTAKFVAGNSSERQTAALPDMSIFYETDTGDRYRLEDSVWNWLDNIHS